MADDRDSGANMGHADAGNLPMPGPAAALRILELMRSKTSAEEWALLLKAPLFDAIVGGDGDLTVALLDVGADATQVDSEGVSILGVASREGRPGVISAIAARHPEALHQTEADSGYGAIHHAAKRSKTESIDALVRAGANVELQDAEGSTALHVAAATADCEAAVAALLRHGADKERADNDGLTPLLVAIREGNEATASVLIEAGARLVGGYDDRTVLELAIDGGCISIMRTLVQRGVDVGVNSGGGKAMHWAAWVNDDRAIDFLVEMGADVDAKDDDDSTPLHVAAQTAGNLSAIRTLAWHGADVNARKSNGDTPLHVAASNPYFEESPATVDALLRAGADEMKVNDASETPAHVLDRQVPMDFLLDEEMDRIVQVRKLLVNAPADRADRAWARRSFVVMCRAFSGRVQFTDKLRSSPAVDYTTNSPKKAALRKARQGESSGSDFRVAMSSLIGLQADLFRAIVEFL